VNEHSAIISEVHFPIPQFICQLLNLCLATKSFIL